MAWMTLNVSQGGQELVRREAVQAAIVKGDFRYGKQPASIDVELILHGGRSVETKCESLDQLRSLLEVDTDD